MTSINEQGAIFIKVRELIDYIRSTIIYNEKLNKFKKYVEDNGEAAQNYILAYDFDDQDFVIGAVTRINDLESNVLTLASVTVLNNQWAVIEKVF